MANADPSKSSDEIERHNASSLLVKASLENFKDVFKKFDLQSFTRLSRSCKLVHQMCQKAEPLHTVKVKQLDVKGHVIKLKLENEKKIELEALDHTNFKMHVQYFWFVSSCTEEFLNNAAERLKSKIVTIDRLNLLGILVNVEQLNRFVEQLAFSEIRIWTCCPEGYLSAENPILQITKVLSLPQPIACSPNFLRLYSFEEIYITFTEKLPLNFFRQLLEEVVSGRRSLKFWSLDPFDLTNHEQIFNNWRVVNEGEEANHVNRPLVVRSVEYAKIGLIGYRVIPTTGDPYRLLLRRGDTLCLSEYIDDDDDSDTEPDSDDIHETIDSDGTDDGEMEDEQADDEDITDDNHFDGEDI